VCDCEYTVQQVLALDLELFSLQPQLSPEIRVLSLQRREC